MIGRRVKSFEEIERPGDYFGPTAQNLVWFLLPTARDDDAPPSARGLLHVASPPHCYRECDDGSLEIRESISDQPCSTGWHGFLDEGHVWRQV